MDHIDESPRTTYVKKINWTKEMTLHLIQLYESHPYLWDHRVEGYRNRPKRKTALDEISNTLGISSTEVLKKIHNLRRTFLEIQKKLLKNKDDQEGGDSYVVKWEFYEPLKFLGTSAGYHEGATESMIKEEYSCSEDVSYDLKEERQCEYSPNSFLSEESSSQIASTPKPEKQCKKRRQELEQALLNQCLGVIASSADSFKIFGDYVADELRNMNLKASDLQLQAKREIQRVILDMNDKYAARLHLGDNQN